MRHLKWRLVILEKGQRRYEGYIPVKMSSRTIERAMSHQQRLELEGQEQIAADESLGMHRDWDANSPAIAV